MLAMARRSAIADLLRDSGAVTVTEVESRFGVSPMTARRDLAELERQGIARRTHGGAVLPSISAQEDSFAQRVEVATEAKAQPRRGGRGDALAARDDLPGLRARPRTSSRARSSTSGSA